MKGSIRTCVDLRREASGISRGIDQRFEFERRRIEYLVEGTKIPPKSQLLSCAELSFDDKVGDFIMSTSPYHIASLLDKVRHVKFCFYTAIVACAQTCTSRYKFKNACCFDRSVSFCGLKYTSLYPHVSFQFFLSRDLCRSYY